MQTKSAVIKEVDVDHQQGKIWVQLNCGTMFPIHHTFSAGYLSDITRIEEILKFVKADNVEKLAEKQVRVVVEEEGAACKLIAIGAATKNKFIDLYGGEFPVSERRIFRRYELAKKRRMFINNLKAKWNMLRGRTEL